MSLLRTLMNRCDLWHSFIVHVLFFIEVSKTISLLNETLMMVVMNMLS
jgi:hypothetical protein